MRTAKTQKELHALQAALQHDDCTAEHAELATDNARLRYVVEQRRLAKACILLQHAVHLSKQVAQLRADLLAAKAQHAQQLQQAQVCASMKVLGVTATQVDEREATAALHTVQQHVAHLQAERAAAQHDADMAHAVLSRLQAQHAQHAAGLEELKRHHECVCACYDW